MQSQQSKSAHNKPLPLHQLLGRGKPLPLHQLLSSKVAPKILPSRHQDNQQQTYVSFSIIVPRPVLEIGQRLDVQVSVSSVPAGRTFSSFVVSVETEITFRGGQRHSINSDANETSDVMTETVILSEPLARVADSWEDRLLNMKSSYRPRTFSLKPGL